MHWSLVVVVSVVASIVVVGITHTFTGWGGGPMYAGAYAGAGEAQATGFGRRHAWRGQRGGGHAAFCNRESGEWIGDMMVVAERRLDLRPEQRAAWTELDAAVRTAGAEIAALCKQFQTASTGNADERLGQAETAMEAGLGMVRQVRPAFHALYQTLDDSQRQVVDAFAAHRSRRH
jgi:hypothetical protein